jgi:hypothetical protein
MKFVRAISIPLAIFVAVLIQIIALAWYWIVEPFEFMFWLLPVVILVWLTIILSIIAAFAFRGAKRVTPLLLVIGSLALTIYSPYTTYSARLDFLQKRQDLKAIALEAQQRALPFEIYWSYELEPERLFTEYKLPEDRRWLVENDSIYTSDVECGRYVFFPTFYGIPDGAGGFLFVPECARAEQFPGDRFGAKWSGVWRLEDRWYRIDGT